MSASDTDDGLLRVALVIVAAFVLAPVLLAALFVPTMGLLGWGEMGMVAPRGGVAFVAPLVWLVVLLGVGYLLYRGVVGSVREAGPGDRALEELRIAYARGDLSHEEYEERRQRLERDAEGSR